VARVTIPRARLTPRARARAVASALGGVACLLLVWAVLANREEILLAVRAGNILESNAISGVTPEASYQVIGRAQLLGLGLGALLFGWALLHARRARTALGGAAAWVLARPYLVVLPMVALVFAGLIEARSIVVNGHAYLGLDDDAMISLRYASNLKSHLGLVYNPGERVEGYTNPLWVVLMAVPLWLGVSARVAPYVVMSSNFVLVGATAASMLAILRRLRCPTWAALAATLAFTFDCNTVYFAASGLETSLLAFLVTASILAMLRGAPLPTFALLAALPLARSDGALTALILTATAVWHFRERRLGLRGLPLVVALPVAHVVFRRVYYGEWYPNTYFLKMLALHDRLTLGTGGYGFRLAWLYGVWIILALCATALRRERAIAVGSLVAFVALSAYAVFVGGDTFWFVRFVAPTLPLLYMAGARSLGSLRSASAASPRAVTLTLFALALAATPVQTAFGELGHQSPIGDWVRNSVTTAQWMTANVPAGSSATVYPAGTIPFYAADLRFIDVLGKNDRHIAHQPHYESIVIGHNRFDYDYVYDVKKPDMAFVDRGCGDFEAPRYMTEAERAALRVHDPIHSPAWDYDRTNPTFMALYATNAVHFLGEAPVLLGCIFVREGSDVPQFWSRDGAVPRARAFRHAFGTPSNGPAAPAGRWQVVPAAGGSPAMATSRGDVEGEGLLDLWIEPSAELVVEGCLVPSKLGELALVDPSEEPLDVNLGVRVPTEKLEPSERCPGTRVRWRISPATLQRRKSATRLRFAAGLTLYWVEGASTSR